MQRLKTLLRFEFSPILLSTNFMSNIKSFNKSKKKLYPLSFSLISALILMVNSTEVGDDDGHRKSDDQHSTEGTNPPDNFTRNRFGHLKKFTWLFMKAFKREMAAIYHITVTQRRHGDNCVPKCCRNRSKVRSIDVLFSVKHHSCKDDDGHGQ